MLRMALAVIVATAIDGRTTTVSNDVKEEHFEMVFELFWRLELAVVFSNQSTQRQTGDSTMRCLWLLVYAICPGC